MMALWPQSESYTHFSTNINKENGITLAVLQRSGLHRNLKQHDHLQVEDTMIKSGLSSRNRQLQEAEADEFCCWMRAELLQSCLTLCNAMDCSRQESSVHGILRARILDWVAMPSSRGSSWPRDQTWVSYGSCIDRRVLYHQCHHWQRVEVHWLVLCITCNSVQSLNRVPLFVTPWIAAHQASLSITNSQSLDTLGSSRSKGQATMGWLP